MQYVTAERDTLKKQLAAINSQNSTVTTAPLFFREMHAAITEGKCAAAAISESGDLEKKMRSSGLFVRHRIPRIHYLSPRMYPVRRLEFQSGDQKGQSPQGMRFSVFTLGCRGPVTFQEVGSRLSSLREKRGRSAIRYLQVQLQAFSPRGNTDYNILQGRRRLSTSYSRSVPS